MSDESIIVEITEDTKIVGDIDGPSLTFSSEEKLPGTEEAAE